MSPNILLAALLATTLASAASASVTTVSMPPGATDIDFRFAPGTCIDGIRLGGIDGGPYTFTYRGCGTGDIDRIDFIYNNAPTGMALFGVFDAGAPETINRPTVAILDAWWTIGGVFYQPVWTDGSSHVVVTVPEPESWALAIAGLGVLWAQRRRLRPSKP